MSDSGIQHLEQLFTKAISLEPEQRAVFVQDACCGDPRLKNRINELLTAYDRPRDFLQERSDAAQYDSESLGPLTAEGRRMGQYTIRRVVAAGGMGVVYEAVQDRPHRVVALKVLRGALFHEDKSLRRFQLEVEILGRLQHPNIARIYDAGIHEPAGGTLNAVPYFAMEWVDGPSIIEYAESRRLGLRERLLLMAEVCRAVHYAHQRGVIHRDLKPANILVVDEASEQTQFALPKILDFGVARATRSDLLVTTLQTDVGQLIGTVPYMSPEQMLGDPHEVGTRSDVYALGVTLYVLLAGRLPHEVGRKPVPEAIRIVREEKIPSLGTVDKSLRGDIETIVGKALEKDKTRRYQSASDLAADIDRCLDGKAIQAHPPSTVYQLGKLIKRHRLPFALACFMLVLTVAFGTTVSVLAVRLNRQRLAALEALANEEHARQAEAQQRLLVERRSSDVRDLAMTFAFTVHDAIAELEGATRAKKLILATSLEYLDALALQQDGDIDLQRDLANAYIRIAGIQGDPYRPNLGQTKLALENGQKGLELALPLMEAHRDRVDFLQTVVLGKNLIASLFDTTGKASEAIETYQSALRLREELGRLGSDNLSYPRLDRIHQRFGLTLLRLGDPAKALEQFERSVALMEQLIEVYPEHQRLPTNLAGTLVNIATCRFALSGPQSVLEPAEKARRFLEQAIETEPDNYDYRRDLASAYSTLGRAWAAQGNFEKGIQFLESALGEFQVQIDSDAENVSAYHNMSVILHMLGEIRSASNDLEGALDHFEQMLEITTTLSAANPESMMHKRDRAMALNLMGVTQQRLGRVDEAVRQLTAAGEQFEELARSDVESPGPRRDLTVSYFALAQIHEDLARRDADDQDERRGHWNQARIWYVACRGIYESLRADELDLPVDADVMNTLGVRISQCEESLRSPNAGPQGR